MLTIAKLSAGGEAYYLSTVASGVEDYYVGTGEVAGYWAGTAAAGLGAAGDVTAETLRAVLGGTDARGGRLVGLRGNRRVPGWDATVAAPKSVSLLWALGEPDVADRVRQAHDVVAAALGYLEEHAAFCRRGTNGVERVQADGLAAAAFRHRSSRNLDPHLHTHVLIANQARAVDDGAGAPWSRRSCTPRRPPPGTCTRRCCAGSSPPSWGWRGGRWSTATPTSPAFPGR